MKEIIMHAKKRELGKRHVRSLHRQGMIPAVLYGHGFANENLSLNLGNFQKLMGHIGESTLIDLVIDEAKPVKVLVVDIQRSPLTSQAIHIDFHQVNMDEEIETEIALVLVGEAPVVKALGGILIKSVEAFKVKCLPGALVDKILVDISGLNNFSDRITIRDIAIPEGIKLLENMDVVVVSVTQPEEETVPEVGPVSVEEVQKVGEERKEGEEGAETPQAKSDTKEKAGKEK